MSAALTNCDTCVHDYPVEDGGRMCRKIDVLLSTEGDADELFEWTAVNSDNDGAPIPGATGCPDHAVKGGSS